MTEAKQLEERQNIIQSYRQAIRYSLPFVRHEQRVILEALKKELDVELQEILTIRFPLDK